MGFIIKPVPLYILALGLWGASLSQGADISITNQYIDAGALVSRDAPGNLTLENKDSIAITLKTVDSDAATRVELLEHSMEDGSLTQLKQGVVLPPGKPVSFDDGQYQVVFKGLKKSLGQGDKIDLTLHFSDGDAIDVQLPVKEKMAADSNTIKLTHASVRATHPGMSSSAAYMTIENHGKDRVRLVSLKSPVARKTELHTTLMKDGVMKMQEVEHLNIAPGDRVELKPGGMHVMLMGIRDQIKEGERVPVSMTFSNGQTVRVEAMATSEIKGQGMAH